MTKDVFTLREDQKILVAESLMRDAKIRHIPVVDARRRVIGIVSQRDVLRAAISCLTTKLAAVEKRQHLGGSTIREIMRPNVHSIWPDAPVQDAAGQMRRLKIGCLPVLDGDELVGIVSEHDLLVLMEHLPSNRLD
jgi:CBS domain-containing protein